MEVSSNEAVSNEKTTILDGKVHLFTRRPSSPFWWCGFFFKGKFIRATTKELSLAPAKKFAEDWYFEQRASIQAGTLKVTKEKTLRDAAAVALADYGAGVARGERSKHYLNSMTICLNSRVLPFIGDTPISAVNTAVWNNLKNELYKRQPPGKVIARATLHQYKNAIRVACNAAVRCGWLENAPKLKDEYGRRTQTKPRAWFEREEYERLLKATEAHITKLAKTRWRVAVEELRDYVVFVANTGLRIGEANNVRFCDIEVLQDFSEKDAAGKPRRYRLIKNIKGKRGTGECKSYWDAVAAFENILSRRKPIGGAASTEKLFLEHHRDMFNSILEQLDLKVTKGQPPLKRDLVSLRHTYICFRLMNGANVYDIASNCRTSVDMIERHYAQWLRPRMSQTINRTLAPAELRAAA